MEQASGDWLFYIDPDERLPDLLVSEIKEIVKDTVHSAFRLNRRNHYFGHWLRHGSQYPDTQLRLFRKGMAKFPNQHVHEKLNVLGSIGKLQNDMLHFPYRNISQFLSKFDFYTGVEAGYLRDAGVRVNFSNTLRFTVLKPFTRFFRRYIFKGGFRDGLPGLFCSVFDVLNYVVRYFKLWEMSIMYKIQNPLCNNLRLNRLFKGFNSTFKNFCSQNFFPIKHQCSGIIFC